jgi:hypothetical protein
VLALEVLHMPFNFIFSLVYHMHGFAGVGGRGIKNKNKFKNLKIFIFIFNQYSSALEGGHTINRVYN